MDIALRLLKTKVKSYRSLDVQRPEEEALRPYFCDESRNPVDLFFEAFMLLVVEECTATLSVKRSER